MTDTNQQLWSNFSDSIKSSSTRKQYESILRSFMAFCGFKQYSQLMIKNRKNLQQKIIAYIADKKKQKHSAHTCNVHLSALWHFYQYNDVTDINWTKLRAFSGEHQKTVEDRAYTIEEIRRLMEFTDLRGKCLIL